MIKNLIASGVATVSLLLGRALWDHYGLPYGRLAWALSFAAGAWFAVSLYLTRRETGKLEARRQTDRERLAELCEDADKEEMIEDLLLLCDKKELEKIKARLRAMPAGRRRLRPIYESVMESDDG